MATRVRMQVDGLQELGRSMFGLSNDIQKRVSRAATSAAARLVAEKARQNIEALGLVDTGNLKAAVSIAVDRRNTLTSAHKVGVRSGGGFREGDLKGGKTSDVKAAKTGGKLGVDAFYWRFLELGTVKRGPTPFLEPALSSNIAEATEEMAKKLHARIEKARRTGK